MIKYFQDQGFIPVQEHYDAFGGVDGWFANQRYCIDCTMQGGTTTDPSFWPN
jgi:hypothetical protein